MRHRQREKKTVREQDVTDSHTDTEEPVGKGEVTLTEEAIGEGEVTMTKEGIAGGLLLVKGLGVGEMKE